MRDYLFDAIANLTDGAGCMIWDNDYSTVQWVDFDGTPPTQAEIDAEIVKIKATEIADAQAKVAAKAALLERLGITADEAALLLG
jgi:hypothetical protein